MTITITTTMVEVPLTSDVLREIDAGASEQSQSREEILGELARRYASERRWRRVQTEVSARVQELGLTEDDIEDLSDSVSE